MEWNQNEKEGNDENDLRRWRWELSLFPSSFSFSPCEECNRVVGKGSEASFLLLGLVKGRNVQQGYLGERIGQRFMVFSFLRRRTINGALTKQKATETELREENEKSGKMMTDGASQTAKEGERNGRDLWFGMKWCKEWKLKREEKEREEWSQESVHFVQQWTRSLIRKKIHKLVPWHATDFQWVEGENEWMKKWRENSFATRVREGIKFYWFRNKEQNIVLIPKYTLLLDSMNCLEGNFKMIVTSPFSIYDMIFKWVWGLG